MTEKCLLAVNRIACAGRAPVSSLAPRRVVMPITWERTHHANPAARQHQHQHHTHTHSPVTGALFGIADLTGFSGKKFSPHLVSLIKVEGLFSPYIVINFDIVNSESLVQR